MRAAARKDFIASQLQSLPAQYNKIRAIPGRFDVFKTFESSRLYGTINRRNTAGHKVELRDI